MALYPNRSTLALMEAFDKIKERQDLAKRCFVELLPYDKGAPFSETASLAVEAADALLAELAK